MGMDYWPPRFDLLAEVGSSLGARARERVCVCVYVCVRVVRVVMRAHLEVFLGHGVDDLHRHLGRELSEQQQRRGVDVLLQHQSAGVQDVESLGDKGRQHLQRLRQLIHRVHLLLLLLPLRGRRRVGVGVSSVSGGGGGGGVFVVSNACAGAVVVAINPSLLRRGFLLVITSLRVILALALLTSRRLFVRRHRSCLSPVCQQRFATPETMVEPCARVCVSGCGGVPGCGARARLK